MSKETKEYNKNETHEVTGLKIRRSLDAEVKVVSKPRKMNLIKPTRKADKPDSMANSSLLVFPTDRLGITTELKSSMIRAASKVGKDESTLRLIDETLKILRGHVQARFKQNTTNAVLSQRVITKVLEDAEVEEDALEDEIEAPTPISYDDMKAALKEAGIKPKNYKKGTVRKAYADLVSKNNEKGE